MLPFSVFRLTGQPYKMAPLTARRSHSMTDVDELKKLYRASFGHNFPTPFDISAAVGKREKKDIFKIHRPNRKCNADTILGFFKVRKMFLS